MRPAAFDRQIRVMVPQSLEDRLRDTAHQLARTPSDIVREAVVLQLNRLASLSGAAPPPDTKAA